MFGHRKHWMMCGLIGTSTLISPLAIAADPQITDAKIQQLEAKIAELEKRLDSAMVVIGRLQLQTTAEGVAGGQNAAIGNHPAELDMAVIAKPSEPVDKSPSTDYDKDNDSQFHQGVDPYFLAKVMIVNADGTTDLENNFSKGGLKLDRAVNDDISVIGQVEWQVNLTDDNTNLSAGGATNSDIINEPDTSPFGTRLGFIGLDFNQYGRVTFGKQWSAYSDVANFTDEFPVFGGDASGMYNAGTDGGAFGTGRAERAVQYRLEQNFFTFSAQTQLQGDRILQNDTYGLALRVRPVEWFEIGAAFNQANVDRDLVADSILVTDDPQSIVVAARLQTDRWYAALGLSDHTQTEIGYVDERARLLDSNGIEAILRYSVRDDIRIMGGYNNRDVKDNDILDESANIDYFLLGADYNLTDNSYFYALGQFQDDNQGNRYVIGYNLNF